MRTMLTPEQESERAKVWATAQWAAQSYHAAWQKAARTNALNMETGHPPVSYPDLADFIATAIHKTIHPES